MIELEKWEVYSKRLPLIGVIGLVNEWMTIYPCLQQAIKVFDEILVVGDSSTEKAKLYLEKFLSDYSSYKNKIHFIDLGDIDPWPWLVFPRNGVHYNNVSEIPIKCSPKAGFKRFNYAKVNFPNTILCSVHSDIILFENSKQRIKDRMSKIENPFFDSEWFSMITMYDNNHIKTFLSEDSTIGNLKKDPNLNQRTIYDYPGDWGLMSYYSSSLLTIGPDPVINEFEVFYPWSKKTQCEKKGHDNSFPHAIHLEFIRDICKNKNFKNESWKILSLNDIKDDINLIKEINILNDLNFDVTFKLNDSYELIIEEK